MKGGELEVWPFEYKDSEYTKVVIQPRENAMVEFRGDAGHRVKGFSSPSGGQRVSLVIEQYQLSPSDYSRSVEFCIAEDCLIQAVNY